MEKENKNETDQDDFKAFRNSVHAAAERPDAFWIRQRTAIAEKFQGPKPAVRFSWAIRLASAAIIVLLFLSFFMQKKKYPMPDLAAGADQELLLEVERALNRKYPDSLAPAAILIKQIETQAEKGRE